MKRWLVVSVVVCLFLLRIVSSQSEENYCNTIWQSSSHGNSWYESNPTYNGDDNNDDNFWQFSTPEQQGMDSSKIVQGINSIKNENQLLSVIVIRNDHIVHEEYFHGSSVTDSNNVHSMSKSILGPLIGIAIDQGHISGINQKVSSIMPGHFSGFSGNDKKRDITVEHVMTMTPGIQWTEDSTEYQIENKNNWVQEYLNLQLQSTPGNNFVYSTGSAHLASAMLAEATGMSTCAYAHKYLFNPIGITAEHWAKDPQGYFFGGCNLYLTPREMGRFGILYMNDGRWNGQQIVPQWMITDSIASHENDGGYSYGYFWWMRNLGGHTVKIAWGWGGQFVFLIPDLDIIVVSTADTRNSNGNEVDIEGFISQYVIPSVTGPPQQHYCGDSLCNNGETCSTCQADCGSCPPVDNEYCGDSVCNNGETCSTCETDCGSCPVIQEISINNVIMKPQNDSIVIEWETNVHSDSKITYGLTSGIYIFTKKGPQVGSNKYVMDHSLELENLLVNKRYYFAIKAEDEHGNSGQSQEYSFKTLDNEEDSPSQSEDETEDETINEEEKYESQQNDTEKEDDGPVLNINANSGSDGDEGIVDTRSKLFYPNRTSRLNKINDEVEDIRPIQGIKLLNYNLEEGDACEENDQCKSGTCDDGVCTKYKIRHRFRDFFRRLFFFVR